MSGLTMVLRGRLFSESSLQQRGVSGQSSECEAEPELHHPSMIGEVAVVGRLAVAGARLRQCVGPVVGAVEDIEHVDDSGDRPSTKCDRLLGPEIHAMNRLTHEV